MTLARLNVDHRLTAVSEPPRELTRAVDGATFVDGVPDHVPALWGDSNEVLWAQGEPLMLVGPRASARRRSCSSSPSPASASAPSYSASRSRRTGRVLYVAADRPTQAASSLRRMVDADDHEHSFATGSSSGKGRSRSTLADAQRGLVELADELGDVATSSIDSLKDVAARPREGRDREPRQHRLPGARRVRTASSLVIHHQRKEQKGGAKPQAARRRLRITLAHRRHGLRLLLWGEPGDLVVELRHLKQPVRGGRSARRSSTTTLPADQPSTSAPTSRPSSRWPRPGSPSTTPRSASSRHNPSKNEIEKARRKLETLIVARPS